MKRNNSLHIIVVIILLVLVSLACSSTTEKVSPTETTMVNSETPSINAEAATTAPTKVPTLAPTPTEIPPTELYLGDTVQDNGYALTALTVADPATPGMFYEAEAGKKLVSVEIILSNISGSLLSVNPLYAILVDSDGFVYTAELGAGEDQIDTVEIDTGEQVRGWISYVIPENTIASSIKYETEVFGNEFITSSLVLPPADHTPFIVNPVPSIPSSKLGELVEQSGYSLSVTSIEDPATPGYFYTEKQGYKLVAVEITLGNVSAAEPLSVNPLYTYLVDSNGFIYSVELGGRDGQIDTLDINAGEKVKGWVAFIIPQDATPAYVKYQMEIWSGNYLIAGLAQ